jgi:hypothetical protein
LPKDAFVSFYSLYGIIKEANSREPLADATIMELSSQKGTLTNDFGYFTLMLPEGNKLFSISYAGYIAQNIEIDLENNSRVDIQLLPKTDIEAVSVITNTRGQEKNAENKISSSGNPQNIIMGELDAVRSLYLLPGVQNTPQITNGMLVRGGSPDQNVFLIDGNPIFNPTHLLGTLSIVNNTSLKSIQFYKSNFPARFGGGLSSVMDVLTKDGNMRNGRVRRV